MTREKFTSIETELKSQIFERADEIRGVILATLSSQHLLFVGPPGTAKSMLIKLLASSFDGSKVFEFQFSKFSTPEEIFGPPKLSELKKDRWVRATENHLPEAHFALLDEVFEGNSAILKNLHGILNERIFYQNGTAVHIPLITAMMASNLLPTEKALGAFADRILLRYTPRYIADDKNFITMLQSIHKKKLNAKISWDELGADKTEVGNVKIPLDVLEKITELRKELNDKGIVLSDRRYFDALGVLRANAWLSGRDTVIVNDLTILKDILWSDVTHKKQVQEIILEAINPLLREAQEIYDAILSSFSNVKNEKPDSEGGKQSSLATEFLGKIRDQQKRMQAIKLELEKINDAPEALKVQEKLTYIDENLVAFILKDILGLGDNVSWKA